jgi:hypothetical protein
LRSRSRQEGRELRSLLACSFNAGTFSTSSGDDSSGAAGSSSECESTSDSERSSDSEASSLPSPAQRRQTATPRRRALELFAGAGGLTAALKNRGFLTLAYELYDEENNEQPEFDLSKWEVVLEVLQMLRSGMIKFVHLGTPCESFSILRQLFGSSTRTKALPEGDGTCPKEVLGNRLAKHSAAVIQTALRHGVWFTLENPDRSLLWAQDCIKSLGLRKGVRCIRFDQCRFGLRDPTSKLLYRKRTVIMTNLPHTACLERLCTRDHKHEPIEGHVATPEGWKSRSKLAGVYPPALCTALASCVAKACK